MDYSTLDIETGKQGNVLMIRIYNFKYGFTSFYTWQEFYSFLEQNNDMPCYRQFIAHNGGRFDYVSMLYELLPETFSTSIIMSGSGIILCSINDFKKPITFKDSILVLKAGLKKLCSTFDVETPKLDIDIENIETIFNEDREQFDYYLNNDCTSLYQVCKKFQELLDINYFPFTIASLAMKLYQTKFKPDDVKFYDTQKESEFKYIFDDSYAGGRVEVFKKGEHKNVCSYDVNSLYPFVMKDNFFPTYPCILGKKYGTGDMGIYPLTFKQTDKTIPPFFWIKGDNGLEFVYEGSGCFTSVEIEKANLYGIDMVIEPGVYFPNYSKIFSKYVNHFYELRLKNKDNALNMICKLLLNSLYGKFAERNDGSQLCQLREEDRNKLIENGVGFTEYSEKMGLYMVETERNIRHAHKYISVFTTAYARCYMYDFLAKYSEHLVYMDTDSLHITCDFDDKYIGNDLGMFKKEYEGKAIYNGRKQYIIDKTIKYKGIRTQGALNHDKIDYEDFKKMLEGKSISKKYDTFPALKTALKSGTPCKILEVEKTLKSSKFCTNF